MLIINIIVKQSVQQKLKKEIENAVLTNNGKITYEVLMHGLPYFDAVLQETLRLHPPVSMLDRSCNTSNYSMEPFSKLKLPKNTPIFIPVGAIQLDSEVSHQIFVRIFYRKNFFQYYPNPKLFDPSRFEGKEISEYVYMPFGLGPRNCIGERFARMSIKFAIVSILRSFSVSFCDVMKHNLEYDLSCMLLRLKNPLYLKLSKDPTA